MRVNLDGNFKKHLGGFRCPGGIRASGSPPHRLMTEPDRSAGRDSSSLTLLVHSRTRILVPAKPDDGRQRMKVRGAVPSVILVVVVLGYGILSGQLSPELLIEELLGGGGGRRMPPQRRGRLRRMRPDGSSWSSGSARRVRWRGTPGRSSRTGRTRGSSAGSCRVGRRTPRAATPATQP